MITFEPPSKINAVNLCGNIDAAYGELYQITTISKVVDEDGERTEFDLPVGTNVVHLLFKNNRRMRPIVVVFPVDAERAKTIHKPAFYLVPQGHKMLQRKGTHIVWESEFFVLCRPVEAVYNKVVSSIVNYDPYFVESLRTLMAHTYLLDLINDDTLAEVSSLLDKVDKILAKADVERNPSKEETEIAWSMAVKVGKKVLSLLK